MPQHTSQESARFPSFKDWLLNQEKNDCFSLQEMADHGCENGFSGLIYYNETTALFDQYEEDIWNVNQDYAEEMGYDSALELFPGLGPQKQYITTVSMFKNYMVWSAAELLARQIVEGREARP